MFGQSQNSSFGNFNPSTQSSPFGQTAFGKPAASTSFGTAGTSVFGTSTGLFGSTSITPAFGTPTTTQSFGGFGNNPVFGSQPSTNTNLFQTNNMSTFGQASKPAFGFGSSSTSLFGQPAQAPTQQTTPFGQPSASGTTGLFGSTFNASNPMTSISGTVVKFNPVTGTDTMVKNGTTQTISTRHHCITCMKEYESKSLEELRLEDYTAGRKGPQNQPGMMFGGGGGLSQSPFAATSTNTLNATSGFGQPTTGFGAQPGTSSLFGKPITGFGAPATTTSAFNFNSNTNTNLFNSQAKPFGTGTTTSLFGSNNTTTGQGNVFGSLNTSTNPTFGTGFNTTQQNIGLFSQNKSVFNAPATTSAPSFGFGQTSTTNTGGLFGAKPAATGFGQTTFGNTSTAFQNTGFGAPQNNNSSLFNSSFKPTTQANNFMFGNNTNTSTGIGNTAGLTLGQPGGSLFNTANKPSLFSNTGTSNTFNSTGLFGQNTGFGIGNNNPSTLGSNLFGGGGGGAGGLTTNTLQQNPSSVPVHQQILALVSAPFGDSPLLKNLLPASGKTEQLLKPTNVMTKNPSTTSFKVSMNENHPRVKAKFISSGSASKKSLFEGLEDESQLIEAFQPRPNIKRLVLRPRPLNNSINDSGSKDDQVHNTSTEEKNTSVNEVKETNKENNKTELNSRSPNDRLSSNSWIASVLPRHNKGRGEELQNQSLTFCSDIAEEPFENTVSELWPRDRREAGQSSKEADNANSNKNNKFDESVTDLNSSERELTLNNDSTASQGEDINYKCEIKLTRSGYYTIPSLAELDDYVQGNTCIVPNFTIGRKKYGNVFFPDSFDVFGLDLDSIVHFRHKEIIIYPDDNMKPPIGQGLNRKAQVTLDCVWPIDKTLHEPITDPERLMEMDYEAKLRRISAKHGTKFLEYRPETGSWVFKVDHF